MLNGNKCVKCAVSETEKSKAEDLAAGKTLQAGSWHGGKPQTTRKLVSWLDPTLP